MNKIVKNDLVIVISGKDKGRQGNVSELLKNGKLLIQGINIAKKHLKGNPQAGIQGGIVDKEMPVDISNVMLLNPTTDKPSRVGVRIEKDGKKVRYFKSNNKVVS
ncbi:MAG: 50S ribosomal protein L24 [Cocleimonas sp.]